MTIPTEPTPPLSPDDAPRAPRHLQPGDGWVECTCGRRHWGLAGAAGLLVARRGQDGRVGHVLLQHRAPWSDQGGTWGVPGGAIMAASGILMSNLGFNEAAVAFMIALYVAQDSFGTATNVTGDGAVAAIIDAYEQRLNKKA